MCGGGSEAKDITIGCGGNVAIGSSRQLLTTARRTFDRVQTERWKCVTEQRRYAGGGREKRVDILHDEEERLRD